MDYAAFCSLQATRTVGFGGAEPINFREILAYMKIFRIDGASERRFFLKRMQMIDSIYMEIQKESAKKKV